jgi:L-histidine N-alpha-methyltransferase
MMRFDSSVLPSDVQHDAIRTFLNTDHPGFEMFSVAQSEFTARMAEDVSEGLQHSPKRLSSAYLYDSQGSLLYEQITQLPEYYQTRTEAALLRQIAPDLSLLSGAVELIELGSGSAKKTRILLDAWKKQERAVTYIPIDVSPKMLVDTASCLTQDYPMLRVLGLVGRYEEALAVLPENPNRLILFLGGTIGNFTPEEQAAFLSRLKALSPPGTKLLLGFDYQPHEGKPVEVILQAYNDQAGVTARFNRNILAHINNRLNADFDLSAWEHQAIYNPQQQQIEMTLVSRCAQTVQVLRQSCRFASGERILTEISRRYEPESFARWFETRGWRCLESWSDTRRYYGLMLLEMV